MTNACGVGSQQQQNTVFCVQSGTPRGAISHFLRAETHRDMAVWARALVQGSHNAVMLQREFSFRVLFQVVIPAHDFSFCFINYTLYTSWRYMFILSKRINVALLLYIRFGFSHFVRTKVPKKRFLFWF